MTHSVLMLNLQIYSPSRHSVYLHGEEDSECESSTNEMSVKKDPHMSSLEKRKNRQKKYRMALEDTRVNRMSKKERLVRNGRGISRDLLFR